MDNPLSFICILCHNNHNCVWGKTTKPSMYCAQCAIIKKESKGVLTPIIKTLYLGDIFAAANFDGERLCVHENPEYASMHHMPYLSTLPNSPIDRSGAIASFTQLDKINEFINERLNSGIKLIVHCKAGVERSPLAIVYFLVKNGYYPSIKEAYTYLKTIRPVVSDRTFWLPKE